MRESYEARQEREQFQNECRVITDEAIAGLVDKFLAWPLPSSVSSDQCTTVRGYPHRSGTNLLTATEARQMFEYLFAKPL